MIFRPSRSLYVSIQHMTIYVITRVLLTRTSTHVRSYLGPNSPWVVNEFKCSCTQYKQEG